MQQLTSGAFQVRPFELMDVAEFVAAVRESISTVGMWMPWAKENYSATDAEAWFEHCARERNSGSSYELGIFSATSGVLVGGCGLNQFNHVHGFCNLGYWVRESWQRKGAGLASIRALAAFGFQELKLGRIEIVAAANNGPSCELAAKAGATKECLARNRLKFHGSFIDAYVYSLVPETAA